MELNLQFPPTPEFAAQHAQLMVQSAREISGADLDFSPASLTAVDQIIEQMRRMALRLIRLPKRYSDSAAT